MGVAGTTCSNSLGASRRTAHHTSMLPPETRSRPVGLECVHPHMPATLAGPPSVSYLVLTGSIGVGPLAGWRDRISVRSQQAGRGR